MSVLTEHNFTEVVGSEEFLNLGMEQVSSLIASDKLTIPSEEKVHAPTGPRSGVIQQTHTPRPYACLCFCKGVWSSDRLGQPWQRCPTGTPGPPDGACPSAAALKRIPGAGTFNLSAFCSSDKISTLFHQRRPLLLIVSVCEPWDLKLLLHQRGSIMFTFLSITSCYMLFPQKTYLGHCFDSFRHVWEIL